MFGYQNATLVLGTTQMFQTQAEQPTNPIIRKPLRHKPYSLQALNPKPSKGSASSSGDAFTMRGNAGPASSAEGEIMFFFWRNGVEGPKFWVYSLKFVGVQSCGSKE